MARHEGSAAGGLSVVPPAACGCGPRTRARPASSPATGPARHTNPGKPGSQAEHYRPFKFCSLGRRASRNSTATALRSESGPRSLAGGYQHQKFGLAVMAASRSWPRPRDLEPELRRRSPLRRARSRGRKVAPSPAPARIRWPQ